jgi:predicted phosphoadenosine phosphosulfate sulfurtransferase
VIGVGRRNPKSKRRQVRLDYLDDAECGEFRLLPSYKRVCVCILKNDHCCKYMGFGQTKLDWAIRRAAEKKFSGAFK